jgi:hypothetical protein
MSEITQTFVVQPNNINITVDNTTIEFTPNAVSLSVYAGGIAQVNGTSGQLQYNNGGVLGGVPGTDYNGSNLTLGDVSNLSITGGSANYVLTTNGSGGLSWTTPVASSANALTANVANVHIYDGLNGYVLQTDGTGNLTWTAQSGGGGNGSPGGANTQIQFNDAGNFGGIVGTTYDGANFTLGTISNVKLNGGSAGQYVQTDGTGNLTFATASGTGWSNVANIAINDIFIGQLYGSLTGVAPGSNINTSASLNLANWTVANSSNIPSIGNMVSGTDYILAVTGANTIALTQTGIIWSNVTTPFLASGVVQANNNIVIYQSGSNRSAYSSNNGSTWTTANNINTTLSLKSSAYGNGTIIITRSETTSNNFIKSTDFGLTWANSNIGANTFGYWNIAYGNNKFLATNIAANTVGKLSSDNGTTWSNVTLPSSYLWRQFAYGNGKWVGVSEYTGSTYRGAATVSTDDGTTWSTPTLLGNVRWSGVAYASGTFIISNADDGNVRSSTDGITWSANINTGIVGGAGNVAYNIQQSLLVVGLQTRVASTLTPIIGVISSDGNISNIQVTPSGTYKALGGAIGNVGAMWIRTA